MLTFQKKGERRGGLLAFLLSDLVYFEAGWMDGKDGWMIWDGLGPEGQEWYGMDMICNFLMTGIVMTIFLICVRLVFGDEGRKAPEVEQRKRMEENLPRPGQ